ncbi:MAG: beta-N-acetylhexosaminidase [Magnetococcales bacterium]|nr:beta-N-acetylhexosaminidase [Magnetococcales bacterium]
MQSSWHPAGHLVIGLAGKTLQEDERGWIGKHRPAGVILFARNLGSLDEVVELVRAVRAAGSPAPTLWLDQEGGRVQRLRAPLTAYPSAGTLARWEGEYPDAALELAQDWGRLCGQELLALGFGVDCAPVLDLWEPGAHPVIGDRAFGGDPEQVVRLAGAWLTGFAGSGGMAVGKHFPGHGGALVDSHRHLPVIDRDLAQLQQRELSPFKQLLHRLPALMTAHLVARALDPQVPATWSAGIMTQLLRREWGYQGLVVSDAIEMAALEGDLGFRTQRAIAAGCDLVLCCTGRLDDNEAARLGVLTALESAKESGQGPWFSAGEVATRLDRYRLPPGDWRQLLADADYQRRRTRLETVFQDPRKLLGVDPTEAHMTVAGDG